MFNRFMKEKEDEKQAKATFQLLGVNLNFVGGLRLAVIFTGAILIIAASTEGKDEYNNFLTNYENQDAKHPECKLGLQRLIILRDRQTPSPSELEQMRDSLRNCLDRTSNKNR